MSNNIELSVIIPVYNSEKYLDKCIQSVLCQTLQNIEIIIINNGSVDKTDAILSKYQNHPNIKIFKTDEPSVTKARNYGLSVAVGKYIGFVDSDDFIRAEMYKTMVNAALKENSDIVSCSFYRFFEDRNINIKYDNSLQRKILNNNKNNKNLAILGAEELFLDDAFIWNRIFKKEMLEENNINFPNDIYFTSDTYFYRKALCCAKKISILPQGFYFYRQRKSNSITCLKDKRIFSYFTNCKYLYNFIQSKGLTSVIPWYNHFILSFLSVGYERIDKKYKSEYFIKFCNFIREVNFTLPKQMAFPNCSNTSYIYFFRYLVLKFLHTFILKVLLNKNRLFFNLIIFLRKICTKISFIMQRCASCIQFYCGILIL